MCGRSNIVKEKYHPRKSDNLSSCDECRGSKPARPLKKCPGCSLNERFTSGNYDDDDDDDDDDDGRRSKMRAGY